MIDGVTYEDASILAKEHFISIIGSEK